VLVAADPDTRAQRLRTLGEVRALGSALPIDERTASTYPELAARTLAAARKPRIHDAWIAATALVNQTVPRVRAEPGPALAPLTWGRAAPGWTRSRSAEWFEWAATLKPVSAVVR